MVAPLGIPLSTLKRLPLYLRIVRDRADAGEEWVSSEFLAQRLGLGSIQIRKDLSSVGIVGSPRRGFPAAVARERLSELLGTGNRSDVFLVGAGPLGEAVLADRGIARHGFRIVAVFDPDPSLVGARLGGVQGGRLGSSEDRKEVLPLAKLAGLVKRMAISIAVLAVEASAAQECADLLVSSGISGVLDLTGLPAVFPASVAVARTDFGADLASLSGRIAVRN
jgi:redox-sensing transcriptional repressor